MVASSSLAQPTKITIKIKGLHKSKSFFLSQISLRTVYALFHFFLSIFSSSRKLNKLLTQWQNCMTEKNVTTHIIVPHSLVLFLRPRSSVGQCRYQVDGKRQRQSTKQYELDKARAAAHDLLVEANVRKKLKAAPITRAFKDIAKQAILRMAKQLEDGEGKVIYKEYISIIEKYLIKFFGKYKVDAITHPLIEEFEKWRINKMSITPKPSTTH